MAYEHQYTDGTDTYVPMRFDEWAKAWDGLPNEKRYFHSSGMMAQRGYQVFEMEDGKLAFIAFDEDGTPGPGARLIDSGLLYPPGLK